MLAVSCLYIFTDASIELKLIAAVQGYSVTCVTIAVLTAQKVTLS